MDQDQLRRFAPFYRGLSYLHADRILRSFLGLADDFVLPLTLAHGVDFGQMSQPMEVQNAEPIYWAFNPDLLHERAP